MWCTTTTTICVIHQVPHPTPSISHPHKKFHPSTHIHPHPSISHPHKIPSIHLTAALHSTIHPSTLIHTLSIHLTMLLYSIPPSPQNSIYPHKATSASSIHSFHPGESLHIYSFPPFLSFIIELPDCNILFDGWWMSDRWQMECGRQIGMSWQSEDYLISFCHAIWWMVERQMADEWWMMDRVQ